MAMCEYRKIVGRTFADSNNMDCSVHMENVCEIASKSKQKTMNKI